ncbi:MAG: thioesterase family protein, partial [Alcaligenaceae bacterium]|nr:thioesterase family protein [Alcaligenaceae bacterium]
MSAYYTLLSRQTETDGSVVAHYQANIHCQGAWNTHEQHMAPASGLMSYELELFQPREEMVYGRISYDIMGLIPLKNFTITTRNIRPGKTIELIETTLDCDDKTAIIARAWRLIKGDTSAVASCEDQAIVSRSEMRKWPEIADIWA